MTATDELRRMLDERDEECVYGQLQRELRELGVDADA